MPYDLTSIILRTKMEKNRQRRNNAVSIVLCARERGASEAKGDAFGVPPCNS